MIFSKTPRQVIYLLVLGVTLTFTSCQKNLTMDEPLETESNTPFNLQTTTMEAVYGIPAGVLSETESERAYQTLLEHLSAEQKIELEGLMRTYHAQPNDGESPVSFRNLSENMISGPGTTDDYFGYSVAASGNYLYVAAPGLGQVRVYTKNNGTYSLTRTLTASNGDPDFGINVAASGDWLAIGGLEQVHMYKRKGSYWVEQHIINPPANMNLLFGTSIAMSGNQMAIVGGAISEFVTTQIAVYTLTGFSFAWEEVAILGDNNTYFWDIDISGNRIVGNGGSGPTGPIYNPQVYVFEKTGGSWAFTSATPFPPGNILLRAVAIDGNTIVGNTAFGPIGTSNTSYVFTPSGAGWTITGVLSQPLPLAFAQTRWIDIQGDKVVVTVPTDYGDPTDGAHIFTQTGGTWSHTETLTPGTGGASFLFGESVTFNGSEVILGAPGTYDFVTGTSAPGAVFVYE